MSKHGNPKTTTDKVCKYFIEAVENGKYGWFWACPNGGDKCMYKHSLPPGYAPFIPPLNPFSYSYLLHPHTEKEANPSPSRFILKTRDQRLAEKALMDKSPLKTLTLEDFLETERQKLSGTLTPVTPESFAQWKKERLDKKAAEEEAKKAKEATGRAMFEMGGWESSEVDSDEEGEEEDDDGGEEEEEGDEGWDMESMRRETERVKEEEERRRIEGVGGQVAITTNGTGGEDSAVGVKEVIMTNGHS